MRSIRRAAIAGATAASLILGAASAATADEDTAMAPAAENSLSSNFMPGSDKDDEDKDKAGESEEGEDNDFSPEYWFTKIGHELDADQPANGRKLFGSDEDAQSQPKWARYMKAVTVVSLIGTIFGLVVFPAYNFAVANGLIVK